MIVGNIEEVRIDDAAHECYASDGYLGERVMVFDLDTMAFKRGWSAYGQPSQVSDGRLLREHRQILLRGARRSVPRGILQLPHGILRAVRTHARRGNGTH